MLVIISAIAITTVGSIIVAMFTFVFFAFAVRTGDEKVAPCCTARSPDTIYNPKARKKKSLCSAIFCFWKKETQKQKLKLHAQSKKSDDYDVNDRVNVPNPEAASKSSAPKATTTRSVVYVVMDLFRFTFYTLTLKCSSHSYLLHSILLLFQLI